MQGSSKRHKKGCPLAHPTIRPQAVALLPNGCRPRVDSATAPVALGLAPATISKSIAKLEKRLGVSIAIRGQRGFVLTEAGALLRQEGRSLVEAANALASNIATRGVVAGQVTFALTPSPNVLISVPLSETAESRAA